MKSGHRISPSTSPGSDQEHCFNDNFNLADQPLIMLIFHSLSYIAVLHTECLKSTATRLRFNEVMHCAAFPLKLLFYHISELFWCHINLSRASQMCRTGSTVGRCCRLGLFGNGERGSVLQGATGSVAGQPPLAVQPPRSARTGLQLENDSRTSNIRNLPLRPCLGNQDITTLCLDFLVFPWAAL